jgi:D-glycero-D-manno-heptose 1,7-bisphosphate phosphatase
MKTRREDQRSRRAVFLDRDGTLNVNFGYVHRRQEWEWIEGAITALKILYDAGFALVVVTNQSGIARGYYQPDDVDTLHAWMWVELSDHGIELSGIYYCPHHPDFSLKHSCTCRKPEPGMIIQAAKDLQLDLKNSWIIGDQVSDARAGLRAGTRAVLIGQDVPYRDSVEGSFHHAPDIGAAALLILSRG